MKQAITLIKGDKIGIETDYRDALPVNMHAVKRDILGAAGYLIQEPGLTSFATGTGIDRGGFYNERQGKHFRVSGTKLITVSSAGVVAELGTITGTDQATIKELYSFNTQGIIAAGKFYLYDPTGGFRQVTDPDLGFPIDGIWINGYYFMTDGEYVFHTDIADEESINPLKFATAEFMPDPSNGVSKTADNKVAVWGRYSLEYFIDQANNNFAFTRIESRAQKIGIVATHAKCELGSVFYITGGRRNESVSVHAVSVGSAEKIASREIDKIISQYTEPELSGMRMETRVLNGMNFVIVHLPSETLLFNETIARSIGLEYAWSILKTDTNGDLTYRGINGVFDPVVGKWIYGDKRNTNIGYLNDLVCTHYTAKVEWILYTPFVNLETYSIDELEIETIPGHTTAINSKVAMSITKNGVTYGTESWNMYGEPAEYGQRYILRQLGYVDSWVGFKFRGISESRMAFGLITLEFS